MMHPEFAKILAKEHAEQLRRDARPLRGRHARPAVDTRDVELRLCKVADDPQLEELAILAERAMPVGRMVLAVVHGKIVAALLEVRSTRGTRSVVLLIPVAGGAPRRLLSVPGRLTDEVGLLEWELDAKS